MKISKAEHSKIAGSACAVGLVTVFLLLCASSAPLVAQESARPATAAVPKLEDSLAVKREAWRKAMVRQAATKAGCFAASYPSTEWREVKCTTTKGRPYSPRLQGRGLAVPFTVGGGNGDFSAISTGTIASVEGSFLSVNGDGNPVTETGNVLGAAPAQPNSFSLQINTSQFVTPFLCPFCAGEQQFVFSTSGCSAGPCVLIQIWYVGYLAVSGNPSCPPGTTTSGNDCFTDTIAVPVTGTTLTIADLPGMTFTGSAPGYTLPGGGYDTAILGTPGGQLFKAQSGDATYPSLQLGENKSWKIAEFNVFGDNSNDQALFSTPTTLVVKTAINDGTMTAPSCLNQSFTAETNNLTMANATPLCCAYGGASPAIEFMEGNASPTHTATCGPAQLEGDVHVTTTNGTHYDFQGAGEFVSLRGPGGMEIQTRKAPVPTASVHTDTYDGLTSCVSLNTAVAARVGEHRVTYEPDLSGVPDPSGLQLRIDGVLAAPGSDPIDLGNGGRVIRSSGALAGNLELDFPDGKTLFVTPQWWPGPNQWYLNADVTHFGIVSDASSDLRGPHSTAGIGGPIAADTWLPALPAGGSVGPMPVSLSDRYAILYRKFADAWRVTERSSLFDYAPGTSTGTFTIRDWPPQNPPCAVSGQKPVEPATEAVAEAVCRRVEDAKRHADCVFDVTATGNKDFAKTYLITQRVMSDATIVNVTDDAEPSQVGELVTFAALVAANGTKLNDRPSGVVQFGVDGAEFGAAVALDAKGRATLETSRLKAGTHRVTARYLPGADSTFLPSTSVAIIHTVRRCACSEASERN